MEPETPEVKTLGEKMQSVPKWVLYLILFLCTSAPLFATIPVPNKPFDASVDLFATLMKLPEGSTVLIGSDWTLSTRGESQGEMEALLRILMRRNIKFAIYSTADPQAPQVATDTVGRINAERKAKGQKEYVRFQDWVSLGYFANSEGTNQAIASDVHKAFAGKQDVQPGHPAQDVFSSPVLKDIHKTSDVPLLILISASSTDTITIERMTGKIPMAFMVTGVMVPQEQVYYQSGQLIGMCGGLKGVYDLETMMEYGLNVKAADGKIHNPSDHVKDEIQGFPGEQNFGKGAGYWPTLHVALALLILAVLIGNLGMFLSRNSRKS